MKKRFLIVSMCPMRGETTGITGKFLNGLCGNIDKAKYDVDLFDTNFFDKKHEPDNYPVNQYFSLPIMRFENLIRKIPLVRSWYANLLIILKFKGILRKEKYNLIVLYHTPVTSNALIKISHKHYTKVIMYPWGGEILCASKFQRFLIQLAFNKVDFVGGSESSNCTLAAKRTYKVPDSKFRYAKQYLNSTVLIDKLRDKKTRIEMHSELNIPLADYNIVCGYNGYPTHRHEIIINSIFSNKSVLPQNYQLIFPMTYGAKESYINQMKSLCEESGLRACFITSFISNEQMAYLHLITDLFINIQESDSGNAFMIEAIYAQNRIVTGKWLGYEQFEQFGIPYHIVDKTEDLKDMLFSIFNNNVDKPIVPEKLLEKYKMPADYKVGSYWTDLIDSI